MADGDLISRASLLAAVAELKESPWYNFGKVDGTSPEGVEAMWYYGYLQRKEAVEIIEDMCIKKEPVKRGRWLDNGMVYTCSECNSSVPKNIFVIGCDFEGCPYCFARMDGENNGKD